MAIPPDEVAIMVVTFSSNFCVNQRSATQIHSQVQSCDGCKWSRLHWASAPQPNAKKLFGCRKQWSGGLNGVNHHNLNQFFLDKSTQGGKAQWGQSFVLWNTNPWNKARPQHRRGTSCPTLFGKFAWVLKSPLLFSTEKMLETGPYGLSSLSYPRRLERLTICRCHCKDSTFSSAILRHWVLVRSGVWTRDLLHGSPALYQLS